MSPLARLLALPVHAYRLIFSPWVGHNCRYHPTCSAYALEALSRHGAAKGGWLTLRRIARCHPWGASGIDNVPDRTRAPSRSRPPTLTTAAAARSCPYRPC